MRVLGRVEPNTHEYECGVSTTLWRKEEEEEEEEKVTAMAEHEVDLLRTWELRLLRCTLPSSSSPFDSIPTDSFQLKTTHPLQTLITEVISAIESGHYVGALSSEAARHVFGGDYSVESYNDSVEFAACAYSELMDSVELFLTNDSEGNENDFSYRAILIMSIAIASFLAFTQCNITGPYEIMPSCPLPLRCCLNVSKEWENWARNHLMSAGCDLLGKFSNLQYLVFAKMLLTSAKDLLFKLDDGIRLRTISWWMARVILIQQRILDERCSSLFDLLQVYFGETLDHFGTLEKVKSYFSLLHDEEEEEEEAAALTMITMLHLEAGIMEKTYGRVDECRRHFESAEVASGLQLSVTGVLGFRTVHQVQPKAQLVLVANNKNTSNARSIDEDNNVHHPLHQQPESCEVLMTPRVVGNYDSAPFSLKPIQQAVILAQCILIEKRSRHDEMQRWEMAPYIEAINSQDFMIRCFCDILRIRWEWTRTRTRERALLMMEKLVQSVYEVSSPSSVGVSQRIQICFGVSIPTIPALRKEYGELLVSCGLIGEAVKIFEDLELWDSLIYCYRLLEKKAAGVELIQTRLAETPNDPRLWCSLGDITNKDSCYEKALEVSNNRSARAKRSLARNAYNRGEYENSKILWEAAMALNSLYPDGWFALGAAALKARDIDKALDGFTRSVQLDPENGEAWNNIACLHLIKKKSKEAFIAFKEALKFKRNSWQLWENYSQVAADVGNLGQALEAVQMVLDMTNYKRIDAELLKRMMQDIEGRTVTSLSNETNQHLMELLGKILQKIVKSGGGEADIWGLYARWHKNKGDLTMCSEALLKQVRAFQGSDLWKDRGRFTKFANASLELCKLYMEISASTGSRRELLAAEMHLKNIIKQAGSFSDTKEFSDLQACLDEVKMMNL